MADPDLLHRIEFDPRNPSRYRFAAKPDSAEAVALAARFALNPIAWPDGQAPEPQTGTVTAGSPLPKADALVVTYTVAEGEALADVLTPGVKSSDWHPYTHNWPEIRKLGVPNSTHRERRHHFAH